MKLYSPFKQIRTIVLLCGLPLLGNAQKAGEMPPAFPWYEAEGTPDYYRARLHGKVRLLVEERERDSSFYNPAGWLTRTCRYQTGKISITDYLYDTLGQCVEVTSRGYESKEDLMSGDPYKIQQTTCLFRYGKQVKSTYIETEYGAFKYKHAKQLLLKGDTLIIGKVFHDNMDNTTRIHLFKDDTLTRWRTYYIQEDNSIERKVRYDRMGRIAEEVEYYKGQPHNKCVYSRQDNGLLLQKKYFLLDSLLRETLYRTGTFNAEGRCLHDTLHLDQLVQVYLHSPGHPDNRLQKNYDSTGKEVRRYETKFASAGGRTFIVYRFEKGPGWLNEDKFDQYGNPTTWTNSGTTNTFKNTLDKHGNWVSRVVSGKLITTHTEKRQIFYYK
jgi:hypothetical protein